ncbi:hypothetical protein REPUB_Repub06bG0045300 [Reevesia pubescens]
MKEGLSVAKTRSFGRVMVETNSAILYKEVVNEANLNFGRIMPIVKDIQALRNHFVQFPGRFAFPKNKIVICAASSAAGSSNPEVLGVNPIEGFEKVKQVYTRKRKEADKRGDEVTAALVSKDVKYADKQPIVSWGPRFIKSSVQDTRINLVISAVFTAWIVIKCNAEYKPLQFLAFAFVYRIFEKLKAFEPPVSPTFTEEGEDDGRGLRMGKRLLRSLAVVFGCIAMSSLVF